MVYRPPQFSSSAGRAEIRIWPARPNFTLFFMGFWLIFWTLGGAAALADWLRKPVGLASHFLPTLWLLGWLAAELLMLRAMLWLAVGQEVVTLAGGVLRIRQQQGLHLSTQQTYDTARISHLRTQDEAAEDQRRGRHQPATGGAVVFDYGPKKIEFGSGLPEAEALRVVAYLHEHGVAAPRPLPDSDATVNIAWQ